MFINAAFTPPAGGNWKLCGGCGFKWGSFFEVLLAENRSLPDCGCSFYLHEIKILGALHSFLLVLIEMFDRKNIKAFEGRREAAAAAEHVCKQLLVFPPGFPKYSCLDLLFSEAQTGFSGFYFLVFQKIQTHCYSDMSPHKILTAVMTSLIGLLVLELLRFVGKTRTIQSSPAVHHRSYIQICSSNLLIRFRPVSRTFLILGLLYFNNSRGDSEYLICVQFFKSYL